MGGPFQPQGHVQLLTGLIDFGLTPQEAIDVPRWRHTEGGEVLLEHGTPRATVDALTARGHEVEPAAGLRVRRRAGDPGRSRDRHVRRRVRSAQGWLRAGILKARSRGKTPCSEPGSPRSRSSSSPAWSATRAAEPPAASRLGRVAKELERHRSSDRRPATAVNVGGVELCWCPPGRFRMGSPPGEPERRPGEDQVEVTLSRGFWIGKFEVTQGAVEAGGRRVSRRAHRGRRATTFRSTTINFAEAEEFCRKLTEMARASGELPAELGVPAADRGAVGVRLPGRDDDRHVVRRHAEQQAGELSRASPTTAPRRGRR